MVHLETKDEIIFKNKNFNMHLILLNACRLIRELEALHQAQNEDKEKKNKQELPQDDFLKVNFDGVTSESKSAAAIGIIIRNAKGEMIIARAKRRSLCSPLRIECEATLLTLRMAHALEINKLILEGDSMKVINLMEGVLKECP